MNAAVAISPLHDNNAFGHAIAATISNYVQSRRVALPSDSPNDFASNQPNSLHVVTSDTPTASEETAVEFRSLTTREIQRPSARNIQAEVARKPLAETMGQDDLAIATRTALREAFGHSSAAVKRVAAAANCNMRTAKNWFDGENPPNLLYALRLMVNVPEFQAMVRRLAAMESDLDPQFERSLSETIALFQQMQGRER